MATTVHLPTALLHAVDQRAKRMKLSRNRFVIEALKSALADRSEWSRGFVEALSEPWDGAEVVDDMMCAIQRTRSSKKAPKL